MLCDAHCHCHLGRFYDHKNIEICSCGVNFDDWITLEQLRFPKIKKAYGLHPYYANTDVFQVVPFLKNADAIGEIGLDLSSKCKVPIEVQSEVFDIQLGFAVDLKKPVILHNAKAYVQIKESLDKFKIKKVMFHSAHNYGATLSYAYYSFGMRELDSPKILSFVKKIPLNRLLIESDALPDALILQLCIEKIAVARSLAKEKLTRIISQNFDDFFEV